MALSKKTDKKTRVDAAELRKLDVPELQKMLAEQQENLMHARFQHATAALTDTSELKTLRHQIARIETIITEKGKKGSDHAVS